MPEKLKYQDCTPIEIQNHVHHMNFEHYSPNVEKSAAEQKQISCTWDSFYNAYRVIGEDAQLFTSRVKLIEAVKIVLGNVLELMKISAPERM